MSYPFLDRTGAPLAIGDRVRFVDTYYYINTHGGTGTIRAFDRFGGIYIDTDAPMRHCDRNGATLRTGNDWYFCCEYDHERKARVATRSVGDKYEHGERPVWVEKLPPAAAGSGGAK